MSSFTTLKFEKAVHEIRQLTSGEPITVDGKLVAIEIGLLRIAATNGVGLTIFERDADKEQSK